MPSRKTMIFMAAVALLVGVALWVELIRQPSSDASQQAMVDMLNQGLVVQADYERDFDAQRAYDRIAAVDVSDAPQDFQQAVDEWLRALHNLLSLYRELDAAAGPGTADLFLRGDFDAMSEQQYQRWESFEDRLKQAYDARDEAVSKVHGTAERHGIEFGVIARE